MTGNPYYLRIEVRDHYQNRSQWLDFLAVAYGFGQSVSSIFMTQLRQLLATILLTLVVAQAEELT